MSWLTIFRASMLASAVTAVPALGALAADASEPPSAKAVMAEKCTQCHTVEADGGLSRISHIRKTPEAWDMTIQRMIGWHNLQIDTADRARVVKYLSDTQGLAPEETEGHRWALEQRPNMPIPEASEQETAICGRCHSTARLALERRDADEWKLLAHTHAASFVTIEYQAQGRDRKWFEIATTEMPSLLGEKYPLKTAEWDAWKGEAMKDRVLGGVWRVTGTQPGKGAYAGTLYIKPLSDDHYAGEWTLTYLDSGETVKGTGDSVIYTGYEWRGTTALGGDVVNEVLALSKDGSTLTGRWFKQGESEIGGELVAIRADATPQVTLVEPAYLVPGKATKVRLFGTGLGKDVSFGKGVSVKGVSVSGDGSEVTATVTADAGAAQGVHTVTVGKAKASIVVAKSVDRLDVEPSFAIARVGGGQIPAVPAQFDAVGYLNGADGQPNTADDVRVGVIKDVTWSTENFNEVAEAMKDASFAGSVQNNGLFMPAIAGPNPARPFSANNAGDLAVVATGSFNGKPVSGKGHLIVTVQRFVNHPIN